MTKSTEELAKEFDAKFTTDRIDKETAFRFMCQQVDKAKAEARMETKLECADRILSLTIHKADYCDINDEARSWRKVEGE